MWPADPPGFRTIWRRYFAEMERLAAELLRIVEAALGIESGYFADKTDKHQSALVGNYYSFDIDAGPDPSPYRFKAHVDDSAMLTILYQDDGPGGLQLHQRKTGWRDVRAVEGAYVVNIGEVLERWTNDRFVATPHRVLRPPITDTAPRMSVPFFLKCNLDAVIAPPPGMLGADEESRYAPITGREWAERTHRNDYDSPAAFARRVERDPILQ
jgi:isopenicillin N synthase-like dioxygenase